MTVRKWMAQVGFNSALKRLILMNVDVATHYLLDLSLSCVSVRSKFRGPVAFHIHLQHPAEHVLLLLLLLQERCDQEEIIKKTNIA